MLENLLLAAAILLLVPGHVVLIALVKRGRRDEWAARAALTALWAAVLGSALLILSVIIRAYSA